MAARSEYFELGKNLASERRSDVAMNTPVPQRDANERPGEQRSGTSKT